MSQRSPIRMALTLAAAFVVAACGSKSTGPSFSNTISDADAASAGGDAADFAADLASTFNFGTPSIAFSPRAPATAIALLNQAWNVAGGKGVRYVSRGRGVEAAPPLLSSVSGCAGGLNPVITGDSADTDDDGIPNNMTATIDCDTTVSGTSISYHGTVHLQDVAGLYGFNFTASLAITQSRNDTSTTINVSASDNALFTAASANDNLNVTYTAVSRAGSVSTGGAFHQEWNASFTPAGASLVLGDPLPNGNINFTGNFYVTNLADATQNFRFDILTTSPLHFVASCAAADDNPVFDSGVIQGRFNGSQTVGFTATFSACGTAPAVVGNGNQTA